MTRSDTPKIHVLGLLDGSIEIGHRDVATTVMRSGERDHWRIVPEFGDRRINDPNVCRRISPEWYDLSEWVLRMWKQLCGRRVVDARGMFVSSSTLALSTQCSAATTGGRSASTRNVSWNLYSQTARPLRAP